MEGRVPKPDYRFEVCPIELDPILEDRSPEVSLALKRQFVEPRNTIEGCTVESRIT
jgi:hypothetical protein